MNKRAGSESLPARFASIWIGASCLDDSCRRLPSYRGSMENNDYSELLHGEITGLILAAMYDVHNELGFGFLELVYKNALAVALRELGLHVDRNVVYEVHYHGFLVGRYSADLVVELKVNVEVRTARSIDTAHLKQALNYLRASELEVGLAINFGVTPQFKRVVYSKEQREKDEMRKRLWTERVRRERAKRGHSDLNAEQERERRNRIADAAD